MAEDNAWNRIVDAVDTKYGIKDHGRTTRPLDENANLKAHISFITFMRDGEEFKLERVAGPAIIDRKTFGSKRIGSDVRYENVYDPDEISFKTHLYRLESGEWTVMSPDALSL